jgi:hypothetical protein
MAVKRKTKAKASNTNGAGDSRELLRCHTAFAARVSGSDVLVKRGEVLPADDPAARADRRRYFALIGSTSAEEGEALAAVDGRAQPSTEPPRPKAPPRMFRAIREVRLSGMASPAGGWIEGGLTIVPEGDQLPEGHPVLGLRPDDFEPA